MIGEYNTIKREVVRILRLYEEPKLETITRNDISKYATMLGDKGTLLELETWDEGMCIKLYQTKGYKEYKRVYIQIIFSVIMDNIMFHKWSYDEEPDFMKFRRDIRFKSKDGGMYSGQMRESKGLTHEGVDCSSLGVDHLIEFIKFYIQDTLTYFIKEEGFKNTYYSDHMWVKLLLARHLLGRKYMENFLGEYLKGDESLIIRLVKQGVNSIVDTSNPTEVKKGNEVINELIEDESFRN